MTLSEFRRLLASATPAQKDEFIETWYKRLNRQDKEMFEIVLKAVEGKAEMPSTKAVIVDVKKTAKMLERISTNLFSYAWVTGSRRTKTKQMIRELMKTLPLVPSQAKDYDQVILQYKTLIVLLELGDQDGTEWEGLEMRVSAVPQDMYRTLCTMIFQDGITPDKLMEQLFWTSMGGVITWGLRYDFLEILATWIRNGDLRMDIIERCEAAAIERKKELEETSKPLQDDRLLTILIFYLYLMDKEEALSAGISWMENGELQSVAHQSAELYRKLRHAVEVRKQYNYV